MNQNTKYNSFFSRIPHAITLLFLIIVLVSILTHLIPAGTYERIIVDGRQVVVPNSYTTITSTPVGLLDMFKAIPLGFKAASEIIFVVFAGAIMFGFMEKTKAIENSVGTLVKILVTNITFVRFFTRMNSQMILEVSFCIKLF